MESGCISLHHTYRFHHKICPHENLQAMRSMVLTSTQLKIISAFVKNAILTGKCTFYTKYKKLRDTTTVDPEDSCTPVVLINNYKIITDKSN